MDHPDLMNPSRTKKDSDNDNEIPDPARKPSDILVLSPIHNFFLTCRLYLMLFSLDYLETTDLASS